MSLDLKNLIKKEYGLDVILVNKFKGYENDNYFIKTDKNKFVLKLYSDLTLKFILKAENEFLLFLQKQDNKDKNNRSHEAIF